MASTTTTTSFDGLFTNVCNKLAEGGKVESNSKKFASLKTDEDRLRFVYNLPEASLVSPTIQALRKNTAKAESLRSKGNETFKKKNYADAVKIYSDSIAVAPAYRNKEKDSDQESNVLSLAFANRSAALFHLAKYADCIKDIENALHHGYPKNLQFKLYERKGKCQMNIDIPKAKESFAQALQSLEDADLDASKMKALQKEFEKYIDKCQSLAKTGVVEIVKKAHADVIYNCSAPNFPVKPNQVFPSLSSAIDVVYTPEQGRHLIAKRRIKPGEIVLIEKPFASVVLDNRYYSHCHHCFKRDITTLPCPGCATAKFCSKECQGAALDSYHK